MTKEYEYYKRFKKGQWVTYNRPDMVAGWIETWGQIDSIDLSWERNCVDMRIDGIWIPMENIIRLEHVTEVPISHYRTHSVLPAEEFIITEEVEV